MYVRIRSNYHQYGSSFTFTSTTGDSPAERWKVVHVSFDKLCCEEKPANHRLVNVMARQHVLLKPPSPRSCLCRPVRRRDDLLIECMRYRSHPRYQSLRMSVGGVTGDRLNPDKCCVRYGRGTNTSRDDHRICMIDGRVRDLPQILHRGQWGIFPSEKWQLCAVVRINRFKTRVRVTP